MGGIGSGRCFKMPRVNSDDVIELVSTALVFYEEKADDGRAYLDEDHWIIRLSGRLLLCRNSAYLTAGTYPVVRFVDNDEWVVLRNGQLDLQEGRRDDD